MNLQFYFICCSKPATMENYPIHKDKLSHATFFSTQINISLVGKIINAINLNLTPVTSSDLCRTGGKDSLLLLFL